MTATMPAPDLLERRFAASVRIAEGYTNNPQSDSPGHLKMLQFPMAPFVETAGSANFPATDPPDSPKSLAPKTSFSRSPRPGPSQLSESGRRIAGNSRPAPSAGDIPAGRLRIGPPGVATGFVNVPLGLCREQYLRYLDLRMVTLLSSARVL